MAISISYNTAKGNRRDFLKIPYNSFSFIDTTQTSAYAKRLFSLLQKEYKKRSKMLNAVADIELLPDDEMVQVEGLLPVIDLEESLFVLRGQGKEKEANLLEALGVKRGLAEAICKFARPKIVEKGCFFNDLDEIVDRVLSSVCSSKSDKLLLGPYCSSCSSCFAEYWLARGVKRFIREKQVYFIDDENRAQFFEVKKSLAIVPLTRSLSVRSLTESKIREAIISETLEGTRIVALFFATKDKCKEYFLYSKGYLEEKTGKYLSPPSFDLIYKGLVTGFLSDEKKFYLGDTKISSLSQLTVSKLLLLLVSLDKTDESFQELVNTLKLATEHGLGEVVLGKKVKDLVVCEQVSVFLLSLLSRKITAKCIVFSILNCLSSEHCLCIGKKLAGLNNTVIVSGEKKLLENYCEYELKVEESKAREGRGEKGEESRSFPSSIILCKNNFSFDTLLLNLSTKKRLYFNRGSESENREFFSLLLARQSDLKLAGPFSSIYSFSFQHKNISQNKKKSQHTLGYVLGLEKKIGEYFSSQAKARQLGLVKEHFLLSDARGFCKLCAASGFSRFSLEEGCSLVSECKECEGKKFTASVLSVKIKGFSLSDVYRLQLHELVDFMPWDKELEEIAGFFQKMPFYVAEDFSLQRVLFSEQLELLAFSQLLRSVSEKDKNSLFLLFEPFSGFGGREKAMSYSLFEKANCIVCSLSF